MHNTLLFQDHDPRDAPAYGINDAARYVHIPPATLRSWLAGRTYPKKEGHGSFEPLIQPADSEPIRLSFLNLVEAHVLRALRTQHGVPIRKVREALTYAEQELGIARLLLNDALRTHAGDLFLEYFDKLINLGKSGQLAIKKVLEEHLKRIERDQHEIPLRLYPFLSSASPDESKTVVIDANVSFGRPTVAGSGVTTAILARRFDAGENIKDLADDYDISESEIEKAITFERAA